MAPPVPPCFIIVLFLLFAPCLISCVQNISTLKCKNSNQAFNQLLLQGYLLSLLQTPWNPRLDDPVSQFSSEKLQYNTALLFLLYIKKGGLWEVIHIHHFKPDAIFPSPSPVFFRAYCFPDSESRPLCSNFTPCQPATTLWALIPQPHGMTTSSGLIHRLTVSANLQWPVPYTPTLSPRKARCPCCSLWPHSLHSMLLLPAILHKGPSVWLAYLRLLSLGWPLKRAYTYGSYCIVFYNTYCILYYIALPKW